MQRYVSKPLRVPRYDHAPYYRADLELEGLERFGSSFIGHVFLDNPDADDKTPLDAKSGYAGKFTVFGHSVCFGDTGHCDVPTDVSPFDRRVEHPLTPVNISMEITDALKRVRKQRVAVTVLAYSSNPADRRKRDVLRFRRLSLVTYD